MRFVDRSEVNCPSILSNNEARSYRNHVSEYLESRRSDIRPSRPPNEIFKDKELSSSLKILFRKKCAYCETFITPAEGNNVDHFRPWAGAERENGHVDFKHYCWLAFEWDNLYLTCHACARSKKDHFPVFRVGEIRASIAKLRRYEGPGLLDPCFDHPERHLSIDSNGWLFGQSQRGAVTVNLLDLNRYELVAARRHVVEMLTELVKISRSKPGELEARQNVSLLLGEDMEFNGTARLALFQMLPTGHPASSTESRISWIRGRLSFAILPIR